MDKIDLVYTHSTEMAANIFTKAFINKDRWEHATRLINVADPKDLLNIVLNSKEAFETGTNNVAMGSDSR